MARGGVEVRIKVRVCVVVTLAATCEKRARSVLAV